MKFTIPLPLQHEHEALHERLRQATQVGGKVGAADKTRTEEEVLYPAAVLVGQAVRQRLGQRVPAAA